MWRRFRNGIVVLTLLGLAICTGCGETQRQAIEGTVTVDGEPLADGNITFMPEVGTEGPTAGAPVKNGKFVIDSRKGTFAGRFRVEVTAVRPTGKTTMDSESGQTIDEVEQYLPDRYNRQSELVADVKAGEENALDFDLVTK